VLWAVSHRDLYGFEQIFSSPAAVNALEIRQVFLRTLAATVKKNLLFKTAEHPKTEDFFSRQEKCVRQG